MSISCAAKTNYQRVFKNNENQITIKLDNRKLQRQRVQNLQNAVIQKKD